MGSHLTPLKGNKVRLSGETSDVSKYPHISSSSKSQLAVPSVSTDKHIYQNDVEVYTLRIPGETHSTDKKSRFTGQQPRFTGQQPRFTDQQPSLTGQQPRLTDQQPKLIDQQFNN